MASGNTIEPLLAAVKSGELSIDEFSDALLEQAEESPRFMDDVIATPIDVPGFSEVLAPQYQSKINSFLKSKNPSQASGLILLGRKVLGENSESYKKALSLIDVARRVDNTVVANDVNRTLNLISSLTPEERRIAIARTGDFLKAQAEKTPESPERFDALKSLAGISSLGIADVQSQAETVIGALRNELDEGKSGFEKWCLDEPGVQEFVVKLIEADAHTKADVLAIYGRRAVDLIGRDDPAWAKILLDWVIEKRPDPNPENDQLRLDLVYQAKGPAARVFAVDRLKELKQANAIGVTDNVRLIYSGYYGIGVKVFAYLIPLLIIGLTVAGFIAKRTVAVGSSKKRAAHYSQATDSDDEYTKLLATFGLDDSASESQIKRAYREAVKKHHPDKQGASGVATDSAGNRDDSFQEVHKTYNRIMEIRGGWFGGKKPSKE